MEYPMFTDIETVPQYESFESVPEKIQQLYQKRFAKEIAEVGSVAVHYSSNAGLYAEFGKVVCVSIGGFKGLTFYIRAMYGTDEKELLTLVEKKIAGVTQFCGHYIKDFDIPFLMRRFFANGLSLPTILNTQNLKPWETPFIDTMELWKGSQFRHVCGLDLLCSVLGIESPKSGMEAIDVAPAFLSGKLEAIGDYCNGDVLATAQVFCRLKGMPAIKPENVKYLKD